LASTQAGDATGLRIVELISKVECCAGSENIAKATPSKLEFSGKKEEIG
jgi:hypothetical protein